MPTTLVLLAAGLGSRFGGVKQLAHVGPGGETLLDYSVHDAIKAGFDKIVFIIRREIEDDFKQILGGRIERLCAALNVEVRYAYQDIHDLPDDISPEAYKGRVKPWGTGHSVRACRGIINEPFAVINADDYYGPESFVLAAKQLKSEPEGYALVGYVLGNTLSENGGVTRGICRVDNGRLVEIAETRNIIKTSSGAEADGRALDIAAPVSLNFWCMPRRFIDILSDGFGDFLMNMRDPLKDEYLLPVIADGLIKRGTPIKLLKTNASWLGLTYKEDVPEAEKRLNELYLSGMYARELYSDLL